MEVERIRNIWNSERLVFRSLSPKDQKWMFHEIESDPVNAFLASPAMLAPPTQTKPEEFMDKWKGSDSLLHVVICLREANSDSEPPHDMMSDAQNPKRIGLLNLAYGGYGTSPHNRACNLGITLTAAYQNQGYGTEAVNWALDWAFRQANMHSVNLGSVEYNTRAHKCYEKCGFKLEGRRRQCFWHDRRWYDLFFFGILEDEWEMTREHSSTHEVQGLPLT